MHHDRDYGNVLINQFIIIERTPCGGCDGTSFEFFLWGYIKSQTSTILFSKIMRVIDDKGADLLWRKQQIERLDTSMAVSRNRPGCRLMCVSSDESLPESLLGRPKDDRLSLELVMPDIEEPADDAFDDTDILKCNFRKENAKHTLVFVFVEYMSSPKQRKDNESYTTPIHTKYF
uniref:Uncharacterized protein n=1 Tax=Glossina pallidipes TaxID=7398 RepID=A0A1A9ZDA8_GLOPL